jgi:NAD-dependent dihydropyrimidine dehydrogenase PreA subunit
MTQTSLDDKTVKAAEIICRQGMFPFRVSDTAVGIIRKVVPGERELDLILGFRDASSMTLEQLAEASGIPADEAEALASGLARAGLIFNQPNSRGTVIYRLLPLVMIGLMEYRFMTELTGSPEEKELARMFETLMGELRETVRAGYGQLATVFAAAPALDRTVPLRRARDGRPITVIPVGKALDLPEDTVLPSQTVEAIIEKFDDIAVGYCFCRQRRSLLGDGCLYEAPTLNCFTFGKSARHTIAQGFARPVSREQALAIMDEAEKAGLVHKAFHPGSRESSLETSICNCCKDCCDTFNLWRGGTLPMINSTWHLSVIDPTLCTGCGVCVERCPTDAVTLDDAGTAVRHRDSCIGCGVCARFCPENAIALEQGYRRVFVEPPGLGGNAGETGGREKDR